MWNDFNLPKITGSTQEGLTQRLIETSKKVVANFGGQGSFSKALSGPATFVKDFADELLFGPKAVQAAARAEASVTAAQLNQAVNRQEPRTDHIVKLIQVDDPTKVVQFDVMPEVFESRSVEYEPVAPPQNPGAFQKYKGTSSTQWTINAVLTCRTIAEATENLRILNQLRAWTMPYFGSRTAQAFPRKLGAPPPLLQLSGWRDGMVGPVTTVLTSLQWTFPQDVDYIPAKSLFDTKQNAAPDVPFPTVLRISISLVETFSAEQLNGFDLRRFMQGDFYGAFRPLFRYAAETIEVEKPPQNDRVEEAQTIVRNVGRGVNRAEGGNFLAPYSNEGRNYPVPMSSVKKKVDELTPQSKELIGFSEQIMMGTQFPENQAAASAVKQIKSGGGSTWAGAGTSRGF